MNDQTEVKFLEECTLITVTLCLAILAASAIFLALAWTAWSLLCFALANCLHWVGRLFVLHWFLMCGIHQVQ